MTARTHETGTFDAASLLQELADGVGVQGGETERGEVALDADVGRLAEGEVEIGGAGLFGHGEDLEDIRVLGCLAHREAPLA